MRRAVFNVLKALYEGKEVTATNAIHYGTTRITNEIGILRNVLDIDIITDRVETSNGKWFGSYRLIRTKENIRRTDKILERYKHETQESQY